MVSRDRLRKILDWRSKKKGWCLCLTERMVVLPVVLVSSGNEVEERWGKTREQGSRGKTLTRNFTPVPLSRTPEER